MGKITVGLRVGKLTVVTLFREARPSGFGFRYMAKCDCDCGGSISVERGNVSRGRLGGCSDCTNNAVKSHEKANKSRSDGGKAYYTWQAMKRRCQNKKDSRYLDYGGRGIDVSDEWQSYDNFIFDMGEPPTKEHSIDRVDNSKGYSKENCKWASRCEQANNKRNNKNITAFGKTMTQQQWSRETGIKRETIAMRLKRGWPPERAVTK